MNNTIDAVELGIMPPPGTLVRYGWALGRTGKPATGKLKGYVVIRARWRDPETEQAYRWQRTFENRAQALGFGHAQGWSGIDEACQFSIRKFRIGEW